MGGWVLGRLMYRAEGYLTSMGVLSELRGWVCLSCILRYGGHGRMV